MGEWWRRRPPPFPWDDGFRALAVYNSERARGIVHTPDWDAQMAAQQSRFNAETARVFGGAEPVGPFPERPDPGRVQV